MNVFAWLGGLLRQLFKPTGVTARRSPVDVPTPGEQHISQRGLDLIKKFEGLRLKAYRDSVGVWTIGYGHTGPLISEGMTITERHANTLLQQDVSGAERAVNRLVQVPLTQDQFDALVSWTFNLGAGSLERSTMLKQLNAGYYESAAQEMLRWDHAGGKKLVGLTRRRQAERTLFEGGEAVA